MPKFLKVAFVMVFYHRNRKVTKTARMCEALDSILEPHGQKMSKHPKTTTHRSKNYSVPTELLNWPATAIRSQILSPA